MKRLASNLALLLLSTAISLIMAEFILRQIAPQNLSGSWRVEAKKGGYQVNKDSGESRHQFGVRVAHYQFGKHHLRVGPNRPTAPHKVLVLGDSFTFGLLLNWQDSYVGKLQQVADHAFGPNTIEFLNAAAGGWGTSDYVAYYEDYGSDLGVQTVLVFINTDDIGRSVRSGIYSISGLSDALVRQPPRQPSRLKSFLNSLPFYEVALENSHLIQLIRNVVLTPSYSTADRQTTEDNATPVPRSIADDAEVGASIRLAKAVFRHLFRLTRERQHKLIVLTSGWHKFGSGGPNEPTAAFMKNADQFFKENRVHFVDLSDEVYRMSDGMVGNITIPKDGHPNEIGARLISEAAWGVLSEALR